MQRRRLCAVVGVLFSVLSVVLVFGQGAVAEVSGSVVDQSRAVLPGVTVTLTEETTGLTRTVESNGAGRFVLPPVVPGRYSMKVELSGFQTQALTGVTVSVGQAVIMNFTLPVGALTDVVTVTGEAPLIEVTQNQIGTNMTQ